MRDKGFNLWTYRSDDGLVTEQVFNPVSGMVPDFILAQDGVTQLALDQSSAQFRGKGWNPPQGMRQVQPWSPPANDPSKRGQVNLGWPGMTTVG